MVDCSGAVVFRDIFAPTVKIFCEKFMLETFGICLESEGVMGGRDIHEG